MRVFKGEDNFFLTKEARKAANALHLAISGPVRPTKAAYWDPYKKLRLSSTFLRDYARPELRKALTLGVSRRERMLDKLRSQVLVGLPHLRDDKMVSITRVEELARKEESTRRPFYVNEKTPSTPATTVTGDPSRQVSTGRKRKAYEESLSLETRYRAYLYVTVDGHSKRRKLNTPKIRSTSSRTNMRPTAAAVDKSGNRHKRMRGEDDGDSNFDGQEHRSKRRKTGAERGSKGEQQARTCGSHPHHLGKGKENTLYRPTKPLGSNRKSQRAIQRYSDKLKDFCLPPVVSQPPAPPTSNYGHHPDPEPDTDSLSESESEEESSQPAPATETERRDLALEAWRDELDERRVHAAIECDSRPQISHESMKPIAPSEAYKQFIKHRITRREVLTINPRFRTRQQKEFLQSKMPVVPIPAEFAHEVAAKIRVDGRFTPAKQSLLTLTRKKPRKGMKPVNIYKEKIRVLRSRRPYSTRYESMVPD